MTKLRTKVLVLAAALVAISHLVSCAQQGGGAAAAAVCRPSSCGDIRNISYPFRLRGDPPGCGVPQYELKCEDNRTLLDIPPIRYWVKAIWYEDEAIQVIDARAIAAGPSFLLSNTSISTYYTIDEDRRFAWNSETNFVKFINCSTPVEDLPLVDAVPCMANASSSPTAAAAGAGAHLYWFSNPCYVYGLPQGCREVGTWPTEYYTHMLYVRDYGRLLRGCRVVGTWLTEDMGDGQRRPLCEEVRDALLQGFNLTWGYNLYCVVHSCPPPHDYCSSTNSRFKSFTCLMLGILLYPIVGNPSIIVTVFIVRTSIGYILLLAFLAYKLRRRFLGMDDDVEMFLAEYRSCMPIRYTYRQIRKMTGNFREKLGQGGFGSVFRGKQLTGRPVAIKILSKSDSNGQDFINEVATIGRIHHANVVRLVGFCVEGSKRALMYEFMPNGSLDRYIYEKEGTGTRSTSIPLSWEKTLEIAVGIARGIEYLHRGCDVKILHFDIKPQNVLLDTNLNPKISDFGLAKSYPAEKNTVTVTAVRGTIGYMAPELFYASAGGVSSKSDVYSFGMLLMEMAGRRTNYVHPDAGSSSNISSEGYLPSWIYNQLEQGNEIAVGGATDEEKNIVIKLFMVALWCIQMKPIDRPSMGKVVEMLEGSGGAQQLRMPAKPFLAAADLVNFEDIITAGSDSASEASPYASATEV